MNKLYRITPADAGKTKTAPPSLCRWCGSPPRMRGKLHPTEGTLSAFRITPADAGKTVKIHNSERKPQDHPRGCGENVCEVTTTEDVSGSPPRMRGKLYIRFFDRGGNGITPADAGKTHSGWGSPKRPEDHPRGCGENAYLHWQERHNVGSPPRMRGKRPHEPQICAFEGITPADAGKTKHAANRVNLLRDHPRGCGENFSARSAA